MRFLVKVCVVFLPEFIYDALISERLTSTSKSDSRSTTGMSVHTSISTLKSASVMDSRAANIKQPSLRTFVMYILLFSRVARFYDQKPEVI